MASQSLLAKLGMRTATLGTAASLALAAPLSEGDLSMAAHTDASRIGQYYDRTVGAEKQSFVTMGVEQFAVGADSIILRQQAGAPATPTDGMVWLTSAGLFCRSGGVTSGPFGAGGGIGGTIAVDQVAVGSGVNTIAGSSSLLWTAAAGLSANRTAATNNEMFGLNAGNAALLGTDNTLIGADSGSVMTFAAQNTAVGVGTCGAMLTGGSNVAVGYRALFVATGSNSVAIGYRAGVSLLLASSNTLIGSDAGANISNGGFNVAIGSDALGRQVDANSNIGIGAGACFGSAVPANNTGTPIIGIGSNALQDNSTGSNNIGVGSASLLSNTTGSRNIVMGVQAGSLIVTNNDLIAIGHQALRNATVGEHTAVGSGAAVALTSALRTVAVGFNALGAGTTGVNDCTAVGHSALLLATGASNTAVGSLAGDAVTSGARNTLVGHNAGTAVATVSDNVAVGYNALAACTVAENTAVGSGAADAVTSSLRVVAVGFNALGAGVAGVSDSTAVGYNALALATGTQNTAVGSQAGDSLTTGASNTALGYNALTAAATVANNTAVGAGAGSTVVGANNTCVGSGAGAAISSGAGNVCIGQNANVGSSLSSNVVIGTSAIASGLGATLSIALGDSASISASAGAIAIGANSSVSIAAASIAIGRSATVSVANTMVVGGAAFGITSVFFGEGVTDTTAPATVTYGVTGGSGLNNAGSSHVIAGGISTGNLAGGSVIIQTNPAGISSSTAGTLTSRLTIAGDGGVTWTGIATASAPAVSAANNGTIYFDSTLDAFMVSQNGGAYAALGTGTIGGTIAVNQVAFGSGANTIAGDAKMTFDTTNGLSVNMAATGADNLTIGSTAGNSLTSGVQNTLLGTNAGTAMSTSNSSVAVGFNALAAGTTGASSNVAIGASAMLTGTGVNQSVAVGASAGQALNIAGATLVGFSAGSLCTTPQRVTGIGYRAQQTDCGNDNTAVGYDAMRFNSAANNTAVGSQALSTVSTGARNTAVGMSALLSLGTTNDSVAVGYNALAVCTLGGNTAVGSGAADAVTTSSGIVAIGLNALGSAVGAASNCTAVGSGSLAGCNGSENTAVGNGAGATLSDGVSNTMVGVGAMSVGFGIGMDYNVAIGVAALQNNTGASNVAVGANAADAVTTATRIVAIGRDALGTGSTGVSDCVAVGYNALMLCTGTFNTAIGASAGAAITTGTENTLVGTTAGLILSSGSYNTAVGSQALGALTGDGQNTAVGYSALLSASSGNNTAVGFSAMSQLMSGVSNTAIGASAGGSVDGTANVFIGAYAGDNAPTSTSNSFISGADLAIISNVYFGSGVVNATPSPYTINGTGALGTDIAGADICIAGGAGTGGGVGGAIHLQTTTIGASGVTPNPLLTRLSILSDGGVDWTGTTLVANAAAGHGVIYYDTSVSQLLYSENAGSFNTIGNIRGAVGADEVVVGGASNSIASSSALMWAGGILSVINSGGVAAVSITGSGSSDLNLFGGGVGSISLIAGSTTFTIADNNNGSTVMNVVRGGPAAQIVNFPGTLDASSGSNAAVTVSGGLGVGLSIYCDTNGSFAGVCFANQLACTLDITAGSVVSNSSVTTNDPTLLHTTATLTDGTGAGAGTLLNAPSAGDPTKWVPIDDNGTTRWIPTWT